MSTERDRAISQGAVPLSRSRRRERPTSRLFTSRPETPGLQAKLRRPGIVTAFSIFGLLLSLVVGEARRHDEDVRCPAVQHRLAELRAEIKLLEQEEVACAAGVATDAPHPPVELALPVTQSPPDVPSMTSWDRRRQTSGTATLSFTQSARKSSGIPTFSLPVAQVKSHAFSLPVAQARGTQILHLCFAGTARLRVKQF